MRTWEATASWAYQGDIQHTGSLGHQGHVQDSWLLHGYFFIIFYFRYELSRTFWNDIGQDIFCLWKCEKFQGQKKVSSTVSLRHSQRVLCDALTAVLGHLNRSYQARLDTCWLFCTLFHSCSVLREQGDVFHMRAHSDHVLVLMDKSTQSGDVLSHQLVGLVKNFIAVLLSEGVQQNTWKGAWGQVTLKCVCICAFPLLHRSVFWNKPCSSNIFNCLDEKQSLNFLPLLSAQTS